MNQKREIAQYMNGGKVRQKIKYKRIVVRWLMTSYSDKISFMQILEKIFLKIHKKRKK